MPNKNQTSQETEISDENRKPLEDINAGYIFTMQAKHFILNSCFKWAFAWIIAYYYLVFWQWYGQVNAQGSINCLNEDVQDGVVQKMKMQAPLKACTELPYSDDWSVTKAQWCFTYFAVFGIPMIMVLNIPYMILYKLKIPFFEQYKIDPEVPWPWESDIEQWQKLKRRSFIQMCVNYLGVSFFNVVPVLYYYNWSIPWTWEPIVPDIYVMGSQIMFCFIMEDFLFYICHRILHMKKPFPLYQYVHKQHHEHIHSVSITGEDVHWFEFFLNNWGVFAGPMLLGNKMHYWTFSVWGLSRMIQAQDAHCGYEFPWSFFGLFPFSANATFHHYHHTNNCGNYSSFSTIWDTIFDTSLNYFEKFPDFTQEENLIKDQMKKETNSKTNSE